MFFASTIRKAIIARNLASGKEKWQGSAARYVSGHLPEIGFLVSSHPEDFHAYCEVYLGGRWFTFDARFNASRSGRIKLSHGLDAVDGAFATIYGEACLSYFEVGN